MSSRLKYSGKPKIKLKTGPDYKFVNKLISSFGLNTVCEEARCPNIQDCWSRKTATIMILGNICTRSCGFCSVKTGKPAHVDFSEPIRTAKAVKEMGLRHVVLTSVDRDDLRNDYGSTIWAATINSVRKYNTECTIEVLTPDFKGDVNALTRVFESKPDIFSHNLECVKRISCNVQAQSDWERSMEVLRKSVKFGLRTKSGIMVGLGEHFDEVIETMQETVKTGVEIFTIGQYLQPTKTHLSVKRYVEPEEFDKYKIIGLQMGFKIVESGPLVRSSYNADRQIENLSK